MKPILILECFKSLQMYMFAKPEIGTTYTNGFLWKFTHIAEMFPLRSVSKCLVLRRLVLGCFPDGMDWRVVNLFRQSIISKGWRACFRIIAVPVKMPVRVMGDFVLHRAAGG